MPIHILISGPIRPSEEEVLRVIASLRRQFPGSRIYLSTWTESNVVRDAVDVYQIVPEPSVDHVTRVMKSRTIQQRQLGLSDAGPGGVLSTYRMMYGVQSVCELASPFLSDTDLVLRIRTDSMFEFTPDYLESILASPPEYLAKKGDGFDWFALTTFGTLKRTWCFRDIHEFNHEIARAWNPEGLVRQRVPTPITYLDPNRIDMYILREGGRKHYFP